MPRFFSARRALAATLVVAGGAVVLLWALSDPGNSARDPISVDVFARQYSWSFGYPSDGNAFSERDLHVPVGHPIKLRMYSQDVGHSFWVPEWRLKVTIPPHVEATGTVTPEKTGTYEVICAQFCGIEHAYMRAKVVVQPQAQFQRWVDDLSETVPEAFLETAHLDAELRALRNEEAGAR